jgi:uncharacterized membrane protein (Fun14 family)
VEWTKAFPAIVGVGFALAGVVVAWDADRFYGLALLVIGGFLLALPLMAYRSDD